MLMEIAVPNILSAVLLIGLRVSGLVLFAPIFGSSSLAVRIKVVVIIALVILLYPTYSRSQPVVSTLEWPTVVLTEMALGICAGIAMNLMFEAAQMAGQILSIQVGYSLVNILDPQTNVDTTVISVFYQMIATLIFFRMDVHLWIVRAVAKSFEYLPPGTAHLKNISMYFVLHSGAAIFQVGIQIAAPVLAATLVADLVLGLLGKAAPQMPLMLLGPALKSILGLLVLAATLRYWPNVFDRCFRESITLSEHILNLAH